MSFIGSFHGGRRLLTCFSNLVAQNVTCLRSLGRQAASTGFGCMLMVLRPHEKNDPIAAGELRGGRCRRSEMDRRRGAAYEPAFYSDVIARLAANPIARF
jgi:hypothetical protein